MDETATESGQPELSAQAQARLEAANARRQHRLAQALRENLKRRKAQVRGRAQAQSEAKETE